MNSRWALLPTVALLLSATACGLGGEHWQFSGIDLKDVGKSVDSLDEAWEKVRESGKTASRLDKESRCYLLTTVGTEKKLNLVSGRAICGPYRLLGSEKTSWDSVDLYVTPTKDGKEGILSFDQNSIMSVDKSGIGNSFLKRPDGKEPDLNAVVDEPDAPKLSVGNVAKVQGLGLNASSDSVLRSPNYGYKVAMKLDSKAGSGEQRVQAPDGGTLVSVMIESGYLESRSSSSYSYGNNDSTNSCVPSWKLVSKGNGYDLANKNIDEGSTGRAEFIVGVEGDGKDAVLEMACDGLVQQVNIDGKRISTNGAALYLDNPATKLPAMEFEEGTRSVIGKYVKAKATGSIDISAYDKDLKWAPEGKAWVIISGSVSFDSFRYYAKESSFSYDSYQETLTALEAKVAGEPASSFTVKPGSNSNFRIVAAVPVPLKDQPISFTISATGVKTYGSTEGTPATVDSTLAFNGTLVLR